MKQSLVKRILFGILAVIFLASTVPGSAAVLAPPPAGQPFTLNYPRLGMWWPNVWEQPHDQIARYDWVIYSSGTKEVLPQIKALNPAQVMLSSTSACEVWFDDDSGADNSKVAAIPAAWFLTQVGTTLRTDVNASTKTLPVERLTVNQNGQEIPLFVAGEAAIIDGESVYIEAVHTTERTLTVRRGYIRPASSHPSGTRIAAHISFWPQTWVMNLSTLSPRGVIDQNIGLEYWGDYNARGALTQLADPTWDGLLIDRADPNESWLIGNSTARTIDPDQSNVLPSNYSQFDAAWNAGLRRYENLIRQGAANKIILTNLGMSNYDLVNGNNYEGFPGDNGTLYGQPWREVVFGPLNNGSYFEWLEKGRQPNLTMIQTYEDDSGPNPNGSGTYDNPCVKPGFKPNFRKMRYGLTTTLLNDGFFSYEINTNGHGSLCLLWFDEYDNAGQGRGYLGQPLGSAHKAVGELTSPNLVQNEGLDTQTDLNAWDFWPDAHNGYEASLSLDNTTYAVGSGSARFDITKTNGENWRIAFMQENKPISKGQDYTLSFWAKSDSPRQIEAWLQKASSPWTVYFDYGYFNLTSSWQYYEVSSLSGDNDELAQLIFGLGQSGGKVWLDSIHLREGSREIWRRDYDNGIVLVNSANTPQVVQLEQIFRKIKGSQDPEINNGQLVSSLTLQPRDGVVLLRYNPSFHPSAYLPLVR